MAEEFSFRLQECARALLGRRSVDANTGWLLYNGLPKLIAPEKRVELLLLLWLLAPILGAAMLSRYNKAGTGCLLGLFLGPIGLLFALVIRSGESKREERERHDEQMEILAALRGNKNESAGTRECPYCAEPLVAKAKICKHCGRNVEPILEQQAPAALRHRRG